MSNRRCRVAATYALTVAAVAAAVGLAGLFGHDRAEADGAPVCQWKELPVRLPARWYAAGVFDPADNCMYYYGGLAANGDASASVHVVDLADADLEQATLREAAFIGQQPEPRWGHAGVYRPNADGEPEVLWIGGQRGDRFDPTPTPVRERTPRPTRTPTPRPT